MSMTHCPMCENPVRSEPGEPARSCTHCGADLSRFSPKPVASLPRRLGKESPPTSFPKKAAVFSLIAPFLVLTLRSVAEPQLRHEELGMMILGLTTLSLIVGGFILGIAALVASRGYCRKGILGRALTGICCNGLIILAVLLALPAILERIENAKARQSTEQTRP